MQDSDLLRDYLQGGSEAAFAELVKRHVDLVYAAAWRQVGNPALAEDVAQTVFCLLARKAGSLQGMPSLAGWLYRATCFSAAKALRGELRRRRREQEAFEMQSQDSATDARWEQLAPLLDEAMGSLAEQERLAVLLRFFQHKPMREVGQALGVSEAAAKMRVGRSVERLREFFTRRGVACSGAGLAALLADQAAQAAPASLAAKLARTAVAGTAVSGASALSGWQVVQLMLRLELKALLLAGAGAVLLATVGWHAIASHWTGHPLAARPRSMVTAAGNTNHLKRIGGLAEPTPIDAELAAAIARLRAALHATNNTVSPGPEVAAAVEAFGPRARVAFEVLKEEAAAHDKTRHSIDDAELAPRRAIGGMGFLGSSVPEARDWLWALYAAEPSTCADTAAFLALAALHQLGLQPREVALLAQLVLARPTLMPPSVAVSELSNPSPEELDPHDAFVKNQVAGWIAAEIKAEPAATQPFIGCVRELLADSDQGVRFWAACALLPSEGGRNPTVLAELKAGLKTADEDRLAWASQLFKDLGEAARPVAPTLLEAANAITNQPARDWAFLAAGKLAGELRDQVSEVNQALTKEEEQQAFLNKVNSGTYTADDLVARLQEPGDVALAAELLGKMGKAATNALPALSEAFSRPDAGRMDEDRVKVLVAIRQIDPQAALDPVEAVSILQSLTEKLQEKPDAPHPAVEKLFEEDHAEKLGWATQQGFAAFAQALATNNPEAYQPFVQAVLAKAPEWRSLTPAKP